LISLAGKHYIAAIIWVALLGVAYVVIDGQIQPKVATAVNETAIDIPRSPDGHYYVAGMINSQDVTFLVDTGASTVSVSTVVARRIGLPHGRSVSIGTAGGVSRGEEVTGQTVTLGGITIRDVRIVILSGMPGEALLGQNVLRHLDVVQSADRMTLRAEGSSTGRIIQKNRS
jgi:aspartyl protease family protein